MLSLAQTAQSESLSITRDRDADAEGALVGRNSGSNAFFWYALGS